MSSRCHNWRMVLSSYAMCHSKIEQKGMNFNQNNFLWTLFNFKVFPQKVSSHVCCPFRQLLDMKTMPA